MAELARIDDVPDEILDHILCFVSMYDDLKACKLVSKRWLSAVSRVASKVNAVFHKSVPSMRLVWSCVRGTGLASVPVAVAAAHITKRYSHSAVYDDGSMSMFVFGGCTSTSTTFNDLWMMSLSSRTWTRPLVIGSYPSPKACSAMVLYESDRRPRMLLLFGGWTHPSLYPLHQSWRLFNELHIFHIGAQCWHQITPVGSMRPPPMAGHSATVHSNVMVVFGGLQKLRSSIGQFSSSNDLWCYDIEANSWSQPPVAEPRPQPRYGQSQLRLDDTHLLILGGCGGPSHIFNDVWLLNMEGDQWQWVQCQVKNGEQFGEFHLWCHPACKVGQFAVILGKNRMVRQSSVPKLNVAAHVEARWNVIPQLKRGINRGYGAIRRPHPGRSQSFDSDGVSVRPQSMATRPQPTSAVGKMGADQVKLMSDNEEPGSHDTDDDDESGDDDDDESMGLAVEPVESEKFRGTDTSAVRASKSTTETYRSSVMLDIGGAESSAGALRLGRVEPLPAPRLQAFSVNTAPISKQVETRQRQLDCLKKIEQRYRSMKATGAGSALPQAAGSASRDSAKCSCQRLVMFVLDLSQALSPEHTVEWLPIRRNGSIEAPEETILYSLVAGRSELIMFGGIQKDLATISQGRSAADIGDVVSNDTYFLKAPIQMI